MGGGFLAGLFREFTVTLSIAIIISLVVSLTATPMMSALFLRPRAAGEPPRSRRLPFSRGCSPAMGAHWLGRCAVGGCVLPIFVALIGLNVALFMIVPKGFVPGNHRYGWFQADQGSSFPAHEQQASADNRHRPTQLRGQTSWALPERAAAAADRATLVRR